MNGIAQDICKRINKIVSENPNVDYESVADLVKESYDRDYLLFSKRNQLIDYMCDVVINKAEYDSKIADSFMMIRS